MTDNPTTPEPQPDSTDVGLTPSDPTEPTSELDHEAQPVEQGKPWTIFNCRECGWTWAARSGYVTSPCECLNDPSHGDCRQIEVVPVSALTTTQSQIEELTRERDEARAELETLRNG